MKQGGTLYTTSQSNMNPSAATRCNFRVHQKLHVTRSRLKPCLLLLHIPWAAGLHAQSEHNVVLHRCWSSESCNQHSAFNIWRLAKMRARHQTPQHQQKPFARPRGYGQTMLCIWRCWLVRASLYLRAFSAAPKPTASLELFQVSPRLL